MELEELKTVWASFDERLKNQELLKSAILRETLKSKSDTALGRMINYGYFGLTLCVAGFFLLMAFIFQSRCAMPLVQIVHYGAILLVFVAVFVQIAALRKLQKIDFKVSIKENLKTVQDYRMFYKKVSIGIWAYAVILLLIVAVNALLYQKLPLLWWITFTGGGVICGIVAWWEYKRMYRKNIDTIQQSLEELRKMEEQ